ncbi:hypothetical protein SLEP1_g55085 [Rubroshorea leprosula]|uniref:Transposase n=1 Tax=Rubroshorea leprosula TaxID=152421 RepID=A0AAV5MEC6_9ROSI|nr:hypothetical protein SLEP1_g55085 [Rubroshorea leprosula]
MSGYVEIDRNSTVIRGSRSFCQLALRLSAWFYASEHHWDENEDFIDFLEMSMIEK